MSGAEDPAARRARLAAMRGEAAAAGEATAAPAAAGDGDGDTGAEPVLRFRNYAVPDSAGVDAVQVEAAKVPDLVVEPVAREVVPEGAPDEVRFAFLFFFFPFAGRPAKPGRPPPISSKRLSHARTHAPHIPNIPPFHRPSSPPWPLRNRTPTWPATWRPPWLN